MYAIRDNLADFWHKFKALPTYKKILVIGLTSFLLMLVTGAATYAYYVRDISDPERLMNRNNIGVVLLDKNNQPFYATGNIKGLETILLSDMSDHVKESLIASEDKNFYKHQGFSFRSIAGSLYGNVVSNDATKYGGSTITQQLVKINLLSSEKSYTRKYQELALAVAIDQRYTKDEILQMYLNSAYFGENAFGIGPAAKIYFNKEPKDLTLAESSMLIGLLPAPSAYSPISGDEAKAKARQEYVLTQMTENGNITAQEKEAALSEKLSYNENGDSANEHGQHFALMVIDELSEKYGEERIIRSGFKVQTTLDMDWQKKAEATAKERLEPVMDQGAKNAAVVAIDPKNGEIRALTGSVDWSNTEYGKVNMAITPRQPGSSFKPIYYTEAIDKRQITAATILNDKPTTFGGTYRPENYDFRFRGDITARNALAQSLNIPAVQVMEKLGVDESIDAAERLGIDIPEGDFGLSLALGSAEVKLLDMTNAYAAFANSGEQFEPTSILSVKDKYEKKVYEYEPESKEVMGKEATYIMSSILSDNRARAPLYGSSFNMGRPAALKTGTTDNAHDNWTIGYTPSVAIGVWIGNNENKPMTGVGGANGAGAIWRGVFQDITEDMPAENFEKPAGVVSANICLSNGGRANSAFEGTYTEYFAEGTVPSKSCEDPRREEEEEKRREEEEEAQEEQREREEERQEEEQEPTTPTPRPNNPPATDVCPDVPGIQTNLNDCRREEPGQGGGNGGGNGSDPEEPPSGEEEPGQGGGTTPVSPPPRD